jgi:energy-coupling factor transporter ATP-binding protein EcfA2
MPKFTDANIARMFGVSDAENEKPARLKEYFFKNKAYENLQNDLAIRVLVGHKGSGKSALLKMLYLEDIEANKPAIWLRPGDLLSAFDQKKGSFNSWIEDWKSALLNVIANQVMQEVQPERMQEALSPAINTANAALNFIRQKINEMVSGGADAIQKDIVSRYLAHNFIRIYIDDLDRGWEARKEDIKKISTLLNAIRDICGSGNSLQFRIGLRTDVYYLVRTSDESTDKIEDKIVWLSWTSNELLILFAKRIETFLGNNVDDAALHTKRQSEIARSFNHVMEPVFSGQGKWSNAPIHRILMSLQRKRPRDLVKLLGGAAKAAYQNDHEIITTSDLRGTFSAYSAERLQDIINEFSSELPELGRLLLAMKPTVSKPIKGVRRASESYLFTQAELDRKISNVLQGVNLKFTNGTIVSQRSVGQFLYKIDFIIARKDLETGIVDRKFFDQSRFLFDQNLDFGYSWEIHPAYRWALQPDNLASIFDQISLDHGD